jgi:hypothetical protein
MHLRLVLIDFLERQRISTNSLAAAPGVLRALEPDVAVLGRERPSDRVRAVGELRAVDAPAREQRRELGDPDAEHLVGEDVIDAFG